MTEENIFLFVPNLIGKFPGFVSRVGSDLMRFCFPSAAREACASLSREEGARWKRLELARIKVTGSSIKRDLVHPRAPPGRRWQPEQGARNEGRQSNRARLSERH